MQGEGQPHHNKPEHETGKDDIERHPWEEAQNEVRVSGDETRRRKTYRGPWENLSALIIVRAVRRALAVILRDGVRLWSVEHVVVIRLHAGLCGIGSDLRTPIV